MFLRVDMRHISFFPDSRMSCPPGAERDLRSPAGYGAPAALEEKCRMRGAPTTTGTATRGCVVSLLPCLAGRVDVFTWPGPAQLQLPSRAGRLGRVHRPAEDGRYPLRRFVRSQLTVPYSAPHTTSPRPTAAC